MGGAPRSDRALPSSAARLPCPVKMIFTNAFLNLNARAAAAATNLRFVSLVVVLTVGGRSTGLPVTHFGAPIEAPASARLPCAQLATSPLPSLCPAALLFCATLAPSGQLDVAPHA